MGKTDEETDVLLGETLPLNELPAAINCRDVSELDSTRIKPGILFRSSEVFKSVHFATHSRSDRRFVVSRLWQIME